MKRPAAAIKFSIIFVFFLMIFSVQPARAGNKAGIAWIPSIKQGLEEARRLNKPVMLISAAPHCRGVSGIW